MNERMPVGARRDPGEQRRSRPASPDPEHAVADALERERSALAGYFRRRVARPEDAEDFVQDVYLRVLAAAPAPQKVQSWRGFLLRAASNLLIDKHRRSEARMEGNHVAIEGELPDCGTHDPERVLIGRDTLHALSEALKTLSPVARDAFLLVRVEGLSHKEAAARLGIEPKAVSRHVERSLVRLGTMLAEPTA